MATLSLTLENFESGLYPVIQYINKNSIYMLLYINFNRQ